MNNRRVFRVPGTDQYHDLFGRIVEQHEIPQHVEGHDEHRNIQEYNGEYERIFNGVVVTGIILVNLFMWILRILVLVLGTGYLLIKIIVDVVSLWMDNQPLTLRIDIKHFITELREIIVALPVEVIRRIRK